VDSCQENGAFADARQCDKYFVCKNGEVSLRFLKILVLFSCVCCSGSNSYSLAYRVLKLKKIYITEHTVFAAPGSYLSFEHHEVRGIML
jgi:hypothetical protein